MEFGQFMILQKKEHIQKILQKLQPENYFLALLCLKKIKHNLHYKMKFMKEATYIRYVIVKLKICPNQYTDLLRFFLVEYSSKIKTSLELVSRSFFI